MKVDVNQIEDMEDLEFMHDVQFQMGIAKKLLLAMSGPYK